MTKENRLAHETSPYLLQHAHNPVDWFTWDKDALKKAREENKPIFLSVGYSSCHWCHVMAHESFESDDIAQIMNENFVNIKVDREERPDIDDIYQKACQMITGQGGWPLSVFMTPDQKPFHVGTYYPPLDMYNRPGFGSVCRQLAQAWNEKQTDVQNRAEQITTMMLNVEKGSQQQNLGGDTTTKKESDEQPQRITLDEAAMNLLAHGDSTYGGFGSAPKFPNSSCVSFLFFYAKISGFSKFREFGLKTLRRMGNGGMFDQIGGGFHRYSTDRQWLVPHFEKMLYDNALIPVNYAEAYQITGDPFYQDIMCRTLDFILHEMTSIQGGFYSAYDADSEGGEGSYYTWTKKEIIDTLGKGSDTEAFCLFYNVTDGGNWEGNTILYNTLDVSTVSFKTDMTIQQVKKSIVASRQKLLEVRATRSKPGLDDKILTSWNALAITAFVRGYRVSSDKPEYLDAARKCIQFIIKELLLYENDTSNTIQLLLRTYKNGTSKIAGYLEDYAYLACALLDMFEVEPNPKYLKVAIQLGDYISDRFWDTNTKSFFMTSTNHEGLVLRPKNDYDLSMPSGGSVATHVMFRLYHMTGNRLFLKIGTDAMNARTQIAAENPFAAGYMLCVMASHVDKPREITIMNPENVNVYKPIFDMYLPGSIIVTVHTQAQMDALSVSKYSFFVGKKFESKTSVYMCRDSVCALPMYSADEVSAALV